MKLLLEVKNLKKIFLNKGYLKNSYVKAVDDVCFYY